LLDAVGSSCTPNRRLLARDGVEEVVALGCDPGGAVGMGGEPRAL
jgi:hypothetical protein